MTTAVAILEAHTNEVWDIQWGHNGAFLASASRDSTGIIWCKAYPPGSATSSKAWSIHRLLRGHTLAVERLAWSPDDKVLLTSSDDSIKMWDAETGRCIRTLEEHRGTITSICWLPDGTGFITGSLDRKIIFWNEDGQVMDVLDRVPAMITDFAITPDTRQLVSIGTESTMSPNGRSTKSQARLIVHNLVTKAIESCTEYDVDLTSIQISSDSQFALINQTSPDEIHLLSLHSQQLEHCYQGKKQGLHVIRSCFGGVDSTLIASGSEDGKVYVWDRNSESVLEILSGHENGSVNTVAWSPVNDRIFASCSDDHTIRIWEIPPSGAGLKVDSQEI